MKGFKDGSGKFRPTENKNGVRKSRDNTTKTQGVRMKRAWHDVKYPLTMHEQDYNKTKTAVKCDNCGSISYNYFRDATGKPLCSDCGEAYNKSDRKSRDHGIPEKRSGLNKVTILELKNKGKSYEPPLYQVNVNGKGAYFPATKETAKQQAVSMIESAKHYDKQGLKVNT